MSLPVVRPNADRLERRTLVPIYRPLAGLILNHFISNQSDEVRTGIFAPPPVLIGLDKILLSISLSCPVLIKVNLKEKITKPDIFLFMPRNIWVYKPRNIWVYKPNDIWVFKPRHI